MIDKTKYCLHDFSGFDAKCSIAAAFFGINVPPVDKMELHGKFAGIVDTDEYEELEDLSDVQYAVRRQQIIAQTQSKADEIFGSGVLLFAAYKKYEFASGYAFVLFERDGVLYEVNGTHCSCYGLENQWDPEETTLESIEHRVRKGSLGRERSPNSEQQCTDDSDWEEVLESENFFAIELLEFIEQFRQGIRQ